MIAYKEALNTIMNSARLLDTEEVILLDSLDRVLAQDVNSDMDMPPFNKSAMDGYACRRDDLGEEMEIIDTVAAGSVSDKIIDTGKCIRIMTGAPVPEGADWVIKVEETEPMPGNKVKFTGKTSRRNIVWKGEDIRKGDIVLRKGTRISPQHIAILASVGCTRPIVAKRPEIAIISTGDEVVEPEQIPGPSQIRNSNGHQLVAQVLKAGAVPNYFGIASDEEDKTRIMVEKALESSDIILLTGGVSMGDFDFIPSVLEKLNVRILFRTIAIQPGKPTVFGTRGDSRVFGLPGNPVSSFNIFTLLVVPLIRAMMGQADPGEIKKLPLAVEYRREKADRLSWIPVSIGDDGSLFPLEYHGSAHIHALAGANGIAAIPMGKTLRKPGEYLDVRLI